MDNLTVQYIIVGLMLVFAIYYVGKNIRNAIRGKANCAKGCGCGCSTTEKPKVN